MNPLVGPSLKSKAFRITASCFTPINPSVGLPLKSKMFRITGSRSGPHTELSVGLHLKFKPLKIVVRFYRWGYYKILSVETSESQPINLPLNLKHVRDCFRFYSYTSISGATSKMAWLLSPLYIYLLTLRKHNMSFSSGWKHPQHILADGRSQISKQLED